MRTYMQRFLASAAAIGLAAQTLPMTVLAFTDVSTNTPFSEAISSLEEQGVIEGYSDGTFKPSATINRAEFLKIVLEGRTDEAQSFSGSDCFPDVNDEWFAKYVCTAMDEGVVSGYPDGTFRPEQAISFVEATKIIANAFGVAIDAYSPDWYEPFARAIESGNGIPSSIDALDKPITRGEMAEMIWRLTESVTDRPAKAYINVKYPEMKVNLATDTPQKSTSCADLQAFTAESQRTYGGYGGEVMMMRGMADDSAGGIAPPMAPAPMASEEKSVSQSTANGPSDGDYSQTNVQVEGVDEADIVKTDGTYVYIAQGSMVRIVQAQPGNRMKETATIDLSADNFNASDLYIDGNTLVVMGSRWSNGPVGIMEKRMASDMIWPGPWWNTSKAEVRIYDVTDHAKPSLKRRVALEGNAVSSRRIGDSLYLVVNQAPRWGGPVPLAEVKNATEDDLLPRFEDSAMGDKDSAVTGCNDVVILPHVPSPQYVTVAVIPLKDMRKEVHREVILGNGENIYSSLQNLYVAATEWTYRWDARNPQSNERTNVFRFALDEDSVTFENKGSVPGHILNQFSMDEHENTFRIATTDGNSWDTANPMSNNLYVLNMKMETTGSIEDIAPGEQIYSTRFVGDRAYMVTFKTTDPLFVIDTSDPRNPKILGKLKIPGYSNYLHPYDENHLIGFGKEAEEAKEGTFAWYQGMKIAVFDVTDVEDPKELHNTVIGDRGTDSPLLWNHKALLFEKDKNLLSFPITVHKISDEQKKSGDPSAYGSPVFQGAYVYDLTLKGGFDLRGQISHYDPETYMKAGDYWYDTGKDVQRVIRIGDSLVTVSNSVVQSNDLENLAKEGSVELSQPSPVEDVVY